MGFLAASIFFFSFFLQAEELKDPKEMNCVEVRDEAKERVKIIRDNIKKGIDITVSFPRIEKLIESRTDCISWKKLKVSDNEIASFRKFIFAPDNSFDLDSESCSTLTVDTSTMPNNQAQGSFGWCHSFVAADLVSFYEGIKLSAYDFGATYTQDPEKRKKIIKDINSDRKEDKKKTLQESEINFTEAYGNVIDSIDSAISSSKGICLEEEFSPDQADWDNFSSKLKKFSSDSYSCYGGDRVFDSLGSKILEIIEKLSPEKRISVLIDLNCKQRVHLSKKLFARFYGTSNNTKKQLIEFTEVKLLKGEPLGLYFDGNLLNSGQNYISKKANHFSTVIGRRYNKQRDQCEFQIRNSWGNYCPQDGTIICENGNFWVSRTTLMKNISGLIEVKKEP